MAGLLPRWECGSLSSFTSCFLLSLLLSLCCLPTLITSCHTPTWPAFWLSTAQVCTHIKDYGKGCFKMRLTWYDFKRLTATSLGAQWLGPGTSTAGGTGSIPSWGTIDKILQARWQEKGKKKKKKLTAFSNCVYLCDLKKEHVHVNI